MGGYSTLPWFGHAGGVEPRLSWTPGGTPGRIALNGDLVRLEVLAPGRPRESLFAPSRAAGAERLWEHLPYGPFGSQEEFTAWLGERAASEDPLFFAVVPWQSMKALGMASFMRMVPEHGVIEIGHIWFAP